MFFVQSLKIIQNPRDLEADVCFRSHKAPKMGVSPCQHIDLSVVWHPSIHWKTFFFHWLKLNFQSSGVWWWFFKFVLCAWANYCSNLIQHPQIRHRTIEWSGSERRYVYIFISNPVRMGWCKENLLFQYNLRWNLKNSASILLSLTSVPCSFAIFFPQAILLHSVTLYRFVPLWTEGLCFKSILPFNPTLPK